MTETPRRSDTIEPLVPTLPSTDRTSTQSGGEPARPPRTGAREAPEPVVPDLR